LVHGVKVRFVFSNYLGAANFCHKMPFLRLFLPYFYHGALLRFKKYSFNIHKNAYFLSKNWDA